LREVFELELCHCEAENLTPEGHDPWQVVEIVIGGVSTILEVHFMLLIMSLGSILFQGSIRMNLFERM